MGSGMKKKTSSLNLRETAKDTRGKCSGQAHLSSSCLHWKTLEKWCCGKQKWVLCELPLI